MISSEILWVPVPFAGGRQTPNLRTSGRLLALPVAPTPQCSPSFSFGQSPNPTARRNNPFVRCCQFLLVLLLLFLNWWNALPAWVYPIPPILLAQSHRCGTHIYIAFVAPLEERQTCWVSCNLCACACFVATWLRLNFIKLPRWSVVSCVALVISLFYIVLNLLRAVVVGGKPHNLYL